MIKKILGLEVRPPLGTNGKVEDSLPRGREKATNPNYSGCGTNSKDTVVATYYAATASGPRILLKTARGVAFFCENRDLNPDL